jgi:two-component system, NarL family, sensor histidine kinase DesK
MPRSSPDPAACGPNEPADSARNEGGAGWFFIVIWLIYLAIPISDLLHAPHSTLRLVGLAAGILAFCACYYMAVRLGFPDNGPEPLPKRRRRYAVVGLLALIALVLPLVVYGELFTLWIYVSAACGFALPMGPRRIALLGGLVATVAMVAEGLLLGASYSTLGIMVMPCLFTCLGSVGARRTRSLITQLRTARNEVKQLAVTEERLRMARDLHDLAGHSLATITLKAELARRLLEVDHEAAAKQLAELENVSRQALTDIREAVSGYRRPTLAVELLYARTALTAADITFRPGPEIAHATGLDPDAEAALAWCLREATTNILRHAKAEVCTVSLIPASVDGVATMTLEIADDGLTEEVEGGIGAGGDHFYGNGLTGLAERLAEVGGTLSAGPAAPHGFRVQATVPLVRPVGAPQ